MTSYIITSRTLPGFLQFTFNNAGYLVEFRNVTHKLPEDKMHGILNAIHQTLTWHLFSAWAKEWGYEIIQVQNDLSYDAFDAVFGLARNRYKAEPVWAKLSAEDKAFTIWNVAGYKRYLKRHPWLPQLLPSTYLINNRHDDWDKVNHRRDYKI